LEDLLEALNADLADFLVVLSADLYVLLADLFKALENTGLKREDINLLLNIHEPPI
jgi:translation initiation factor 2 beta subunit (eIF-2beta)/eIF-5